MAKYNVKKGASPSGSGMQSAMGPRQDNTVGGSSPGLKTGGIPGADWKGAGTNVVESKCNSGDDSNRRGK